MTVRNHCRRVLRHLATLVDRFAMRLFQHRGYDRPPRVDEKVDLVGPAAAASALVTVEIEIIESGLQMRRSGLSGGSQVRLSDLPEDVAAVDAPRFSLTLEIERLGRDGAALRVESASIQQRVELVYGERVDSGLRTPSRYLIALSVTRQS